MSKKKIVIFVSLVLVVVIFVVISVTRDESEANTTIKQYTNIQNEENGIQTSDKEYTVGDVTFKEINQFYEDGQTFLTFKITNNSDHNVKIGFYTIGAADSDGSVLYTYADDCDDTIKPGETINRTLSTVGDHTRAVDYNFNIIGDN